MDIFKYHPNYTYIVYVYNLLFYHRLPICRCLRRLLYISFAGHRLELSVNLAAVNGNNKLN